MPIEIIEDYEEENEILNDVIDKYGFHYQGTDPVDDAMKIHK